jgi:hypothetical protein
VTDYIAAFPEHSGKDFSPHVTIGVVRRPGAPRPLIFSR